LHPKRQKCDIRWRAIDDGRESRDQTEDDVPDITRIYNHAIVNTTATFDVVPKTLEDRYEWFKEQDEEYPLIVALLDDKVIGWASIRPFGKRAAYRHTVEEAIYVDHEHQGTGIGTALLEKLIELSGADGCHAILALIVSGNEASVKLHEKFGFEHVGTMNQVGRKFDQWLDVLIYEKILEKCQ
jgi:L-amino acid N-acyltransferase